MSDAALYNFYNTEHLLMLNIYTRQHKKEYKNIYYQAN